MRFHLKLCSKYLARNSRFEKSLISRDVYLEKFKWKPGCSFIIGCFDVWCVLVFKLFGVFIQQWFRVTNIRTSIGTCFLHSSIFFKPYKNISLSFKTLVAQNSRRWSFYLLLYFEYFQTFSEGSSPNFVPDIKWILAK